MPKLLFAVAVLFLFPLAGCDDAPKPRQPPAGVTTESETVEELRERRRSGTSATEVPSVPADRSEPATEGRRRTPEERRQRAKAAAEAEAARDAAADRPTRATD